MSEIISPITGKGNIKVLKEYRSSFFIDFYKLKLKLDVSRYFEKCDTISYCRCNESGLLFFHPSTISGDSELYHNLQKYDWYYLDNKWEYEEAIKSIKKNDRILEIGSGHGAFLDKLPCDKKNVECIEFNEESVKLLRKKGYKVHSLVIEELSQINIEYYDVVVSFQVLEHICEVNLFIESALKVLKPGGRLIISVPNHDALIMKLDKELCLNFPPHHMSHWTMKTFKRMPNFFEMSIEYFKQEPLTKESFPRYCRVIITYLASKLCFDGKGIETYFYQILYSLVLMMNKRLRGISVVVVFNKNR